ncbi:MAG: DUF4340 domain-containing protein [Flavobacteriales bacterium]|nr:DUF4340 domain-containing protein [Flavobacteriales bacterium]
MSRSSGTRTLLIIVAALAALYFVSTRWGANSKQRSFRDQVITLDTAALTSFSLHPAKLAHAELRFERTADGWTVTHDGAVHLADTADVHALLGGLARARAHRFTGYWDRLATRYDLTDSLADRAVFRLRDGSERQVLFGRGQPAEDGSGMLSTINVVGENEVFSVRGTMSEMADQDLVAWRPTRLMAGRPADIQRVSFQYSMDTAYVLERAGNTWLVDRDTADQSKVDKFLADITNAKAQTFADTMNIVGRAPDYSMRVEFADGRPPVEVHVTMAWTGLVVTTTLDPGSQMRFDPARELPRMFKTRPYFLP